MLYKGPSRIVQWLLYCIICYIEFGAGSDPFRVVHRDFMRGFLFYFILFYFILFYFISSLVYVNSSDANTTHSLTTPGHISVNG